MRLMNDNEGLVEAVQLHWDQRRRTGRRLVQVAEWVENEHPGSAVGKMLKNAHALMERAGIKRGTSLKIGYEGEIKRTEHYQGACVFCKTNFKEGTKVSFIVDGRNLTSGTGGDQIGLDCFSHLTYIAQALESDEFVMYEQEQKKEKRAEYFGRAFMTLGQLPRKAVQKLRMWGFDLSTEIAADLAKDLTQRIKDDDRAAVRYEIDPHKSEDMTGWLVGHINDMYEPRVRQAAIVLREQPHLLTNTQWGTLILYAWQEQLLKAEGELKGTREDILYLAQPKYEHRQDKRAISAQEKVQVEYGTVMLDTVVKPIKAFDKARWEDIDLGEVLHRSAVTKAQVRATRAAVPYLTERREMHNRAVMDSYCKPEEFTKLLENLRIRYEGEDGRGGEKRRYHDAIVEGIKNPETCWTEKTYKRIRDFFELRNQIKETEKEITPRETLVGYVDLPRAIDLIKALYVEGRKLELARKTSNEEILKHEYVVVSEAAARIEDLDSKLERLRSAALEFDEDGKRMVPSRTRERYKKAGMKQDKIKKLVGDIQVSSAEGIIATRYIQPGKETPSELERALGITQDYMQDTEVAKYVTEFKKLREGPLGLSIEVNADDEKPGEKGRYIPFNIKNLEGKKCFSQEQIRKVKQLWEELPNNIKNIKIDDVEERIKNVECFYQEHEVYGNRFILQGLDKKPKRYGSFSYVNIEDLSKKEIDIKTCKVISEELKGKLIELNQQKARDFLMRKEDDFYMPRDIKSITEGDNIHVTLDLETTVNGWYDQFKEEEGKVRNNRVELSAAGYDVEAIKTRLKRLAQQNREPKHRQGEWHCTTEKARTYVTGEMDILQERYVKDIADAITPERLVLREGDEHRYSNQKNHQFDVVAHGDGQALLNAFGKKANEGKALLRYAAEKGKLAGMMYEQGSWYRPDVSREMLKTIIEKADESGKITIAIEAQQKK